jgi:hypothetical protein
MHRSSVIQPPGLRFQSARPLTASKLAISPLGPSQLYTGISFARSRHSSKSRQFKVLVIGLFKGRPSGWLLK